MTTRRIQRLCAALALGATMLAPSAQAARPSAVPLAGTTIVTARRTASMAVRLPRPVDFHVHDLSVSSPRGRVTAVALKRVGSWNAPYVTATHVGFCGEPGCATEFPTFSFDHVWAPGSPDGLSGRLPAGDYRLYVVTDGAPVTFTFRLRGLSGTKRLTPASPARASVVTATPTAAEPALSPVAFAGGSHRSVGPAGGLNHTSVWKEVPTVAQPSAVGVCEYSGRPPASAFTPYQLPCADGRGGIPPAVSNTKPGGDATTPVGPGRYLNGISSGWLLPPGEWGLGGYNNTPGPVTAAYVHQFWLDF
ncbi:MAG TPA: hypothetical protein VNA20_04895 [Frankiaceae bacterium]|nr:hypothetical protein [Frankiaceae bacterium]